MIGLPYYFSTIWSLVLSILLYGTHLAALAFIVLAFRKNKSNFVNLALMFTTFSILTDFAYYFFYHNTIINYIYQLNQASEYGPISDVVWWDYDQKLRQFPTAIFSIIFLILSTTLFIKSVNKNLK